MRTKTSAEGTLFHIGLILFLADHKTGIHCYTEDGNEREECLTERQRKSGLQVRIESEGHYEDD